MQFLYDAYESIRDFLELGGPVLRVIAVVILIMWVLILERLIYFRTGLQDVIRDAFAEWEARPDTVLDRLCRRATRVARG